MAKGAMNGAPAFGLVIDVHGPPAKEATRASDHDLASAVDLR